LIATSRVRRGDVDTLGERQSAMDGNTADQHIVCSAVNGVLDITGLRKTILEMDGTGLGR
jgi:hypothetical protein